MKKKWIILLSISVFLATVIGCIIKFLRTDDKPKVVVVLKDLDEQYWNIVKAGAEKGFRDFDIDGKVVTLSDKSKKNVPEYTLKSILNEHPDVLVISPNNSPAVMPILKKFIEHRIPVLLVDTDIPLEHKTSYIGTDNFELGKKAGELLASGMQPGDEVAFITESVNNTVLSARIRGATFSLEAAGIKIVAEEKVIPTDSLSIREGMITILQQHPDIKGVFAATDIMALGALEAIKGDRNKILVVGTDGITKMVESIEERTLTGTVAQNPYDMGYISVETAQKVIKGETVRKNIDTGVDLITKDNAKQKLDFLKELLN